MKQFNNETIQQFNNETMKQLNNEIIPIDKLDKLKL